MSEEASIPINPKDLIGSKKVSTFFIPRAGIMAHAMAAMEGAKKYGPFNWRAIPIQASIYLSAIDRHLALWAEREETAPDSGVHHLGHVMASCAILIDSQLHGTLVDDRPHNNGEFVNLMSALNDHLTAHSSS